MNIKRFNGNDFPGDKWVRDILSRVNEILDYLKLKVTRDRLAPALIEEIDEVTDAVEPLISAGVEGQGLRTISGTPAWAWRSLHVVSNADYAILDTDGRETISVTTGSTNRTITLPTASDNSGRVITVKKVDSGTGYVIVACEGSEQVDGAVSVKLFLQYESVVVQSTGSGWSVLSYTENNRWRSYSMAITATTTNPTPGTIAVNEARWRRAGGNVMEIYYSLRTTAAGSAGSGVYKFGLPTGHSAYSTDMTAAGVGSSGGIGIVGPAAGERGGTPYDGNAILYDSTNIAIQLGDASIAMTYVGSLFALDAAQKYTFRASVPISEWS